MQNRVKQATFLLVLFVSCVWSMPAQTQNAARDLTGVFTAAAAGHGARLVPDPALSRAAERFALAALDGVASPLLHRQILWEEGVRDVHFTPLTLFARTEIPPDTALRMAVGGAASEFRQASHAGAGWSRSGDRIAVTFLSVHRMAFFEGDAVQLPKGTTRAQLIVTNPLGQVGRRNLSPVPGREAAFLRAEDAQQIPGTWLFELQRDVDGVSELLAMWIVDGQSEGEASGTENDRLGLSPLGIGASEESLTGSGGHGWITGAREAPARVPFSRDADSAEKHLRALLGQRRRAGGLTRLEVHAETTRVARARSAAEIAGQTTPRSPHARLLDAGVTPLAAQEVVLVAPNPVIAWALLLSDPASREMLTRPGAAQFGLGASVVSDGPRWSIALALLRVEIGGGDFTWESVVREHLRRARSEAGLGELYARERLDRIAEAAAHDIATRGLASMPEKQRRDLVRQAREVVPDAVGVGVDVLVTRDPGAVVSRKHVSEGRFAEVGVGIVEVPQSKLGFSIVLLLVQR